MKIKIKNTDISKIVRYRQPLSSNSLNDDFLEWENYNINNEFTKKIEELDIKINKYYSSDTNDRWIRIYISNINDNIEVYSNRAEYHQRSQEAAEKIKTEEQPLEKKWGFF